MLWRILRSIAVGDGEEQGCTVGLDGSFAFGPARGAHPKEEAQFIGTAARAANRARRLGELAEALAQLAETERVSGQREALAGRRNKIGAERRRCRPRACTAGHADVVRARQTEEGARRAFDDAEQATIGAEREADLARGDVEVVSGRTGWIQPATSRRCGRRRSARPYSERSGQLRRADFDRRSALR